MPRIARVVAPNYPHHITQRGTNKADIFVDKEDRKYFLYCLGKHRDNPHILRKLGTATVFSGFRLKACWNDKGKNGDIHDKLELKGTVLFK